MSTWRYAQNGQPCGPVETSALPALLSNGTLAPDTLVWKEGMANWSPAREVPELAGATPVGGTAPPLPPGGTAPLPPLHPPESAAADIEKNKVFAVLAYLGILFLVPLLAAPQSKFARYHANQGAVLFLASLLTFIGSFILLLIPFVGCLASFLPLAIIVASLILMIMGIINAAAGQCKPLPLIGHFQLIK